MIEIGKVMIDDSLYKGNDLYTDGSVEDEMLDIVKNNSRDEFNRIINEKALWPIMYHLSDLRENLIEWIDIKDTECVLEVGSGCGAITGCLAKKAKHVTCIELSKRRSLINAYRNADYDNIEIKLGNFEDIEKNINEKYDYIFLIGVLEYSEYYIKAEKPYNEILNLLSHMLKSDGKLVIAIENKYGLKYWAGCKEDHLGIYYEGIEGYTNTHGVKTFSKDKLKDMIIGAGLNKIDFYYPYPDYKFCSTLYSDKYLPKIGELNNNKRNFDMERIETFDESKVFDAIIEDGLFPVFANSFLIIASKGET